jgi:hypothetical protein
MIRWENAWNVRTPTVWIYKRISAISIVTTISLNAVDVTNISMCKMMKFIFVLTAIINLFLVLGGVLNARINVNSVLNNKAHFI